MATEAQRIAEELYEYYWPRLEKLGDVVERNIKEFLVTQISGATSPQDCIKLKDAMLKSIRDNVFLPTIGEWENSLKVLKGEKEIAKFNLRLLQPYDVTQISETFEHVKAALNRIGQIIVTESRQIIISPRMWAYDLRQKLERSIDHDLKPVAKSAAGRFEQLRREY